MMDLFVAPERTPSIPRTFSTPRGRHPLQNRTQGIEPVDGAGHTAAPPAPQPSEGPWSGRHLVGSDACSA